jgi:hypothetical protein
MLPPFPPGWAAPPKARPLFPAAVSAFIWRTLWVVVIGSVLAALGFFGIARLTEMTEREEIRKEKMAETQNALDTAIELRNQGLGSTDIYTRFNMFQQSMEHVERAAAAAPDKESRSLVAIEASRTAMMMAREAAVVGDIRAMDVYTQAAIRWADESADQSAMDTARRFRAELLGG